MDWLFCKPLISSWSCAEACDKCTAEYTAMNLTSKGIHAMDFPLKNEPTLTRLARLSDNNTHLIAAHIAGHPQDVNYQDEYGRTALMFAARRGHTETMRVLIVNGCADWELTTRDGKTAKMIAEDFNKLLSIELLEQADSGCLDPPKEARHGLSDDTKLKLKSVLKKTRAPGTALPTHQNPAHATERVRNPQGPGSNGSNGPKGSSDPFWRSSSEGGTHTSTHTALKSAGGSFKSNGSWKSSGSGSFSSKGSKAEGVGVGGRDPKLNPAWKAEDHPPHNPPKPQRKHVSQVETFDHMRRKTYEEIDQQTAKFLAPEHAFLMNYTLEERNQRFDQALGGDEHVINRYRKMQMHNANHDELDVQGSVHDQMSQEYSKWDKSGSSRGINRAKDVTTKTANGSYVCQNNGKTVRGHGNVRKVAGYHTQIQKKLASFGGLEVYRAPR